MVEEADWELGGMIGEVEVRLYASLMMATVRGGRENRSFTMLFEYINGNNVPKQKIAMIAPVITESGDGGNMEMSPPVLSDEESLAFVLPAKYDINNVPEPMDRHVELSTIPKRQLAVIQYKGNNPDSRVRDKTKRMMSMLKEKGIEIVGRPFLMRYNMRIMPGFLKRNEIAVEIKI